MLIGAGPDLEAFLLETSALEDRRGPILIQLPPKLAFDIDAATTFLSVLRQQFDGEVVVEPRHASWFTTEADDALGEYRAARVGADPPRAPGGGFPGGYRGLTYLRMHGAPRVYFSSYDDVRLEQVAALLADSSSPTWCIFDNTASGAAAANEWEFLVCTCAMGNEHRAGGSSSFLRPTEYCSKSKPRIALEASLAPNSAPLHELSSRFRLVRK